MIGGAAPLLALTLGEPAGIGPDIAIDAWLARDRAELAPFIHIGDADLIVRRAAALGRRIRVEAVGPGEAAAVFPRAFPCLAGAPSVEGRPGRISKGDTTSVVASIRTGVDMVRNGTANAIVTSPIQKKALNAIGFPFPGHTEYLGALSAELFGQAAEPVMMLAGPQLRVVPVTIHIPLAAVPHALTSDLILRTGLVVAHDLQRRFGVERPRLAVAGLNPHAGEGGMLGSEDADIVRPAVEALRAAGIDAAGPLSADTMFHEAARASYDAALCMYHDQALIPIKTLAFDEGVNVTLGLPFIRTSPDHGTALDRAGTGTARPTSLIAALRMAADLAAREREA